jgi:hypothetical protein
MPPQFTGMLSYLLLYIVQAGVMFESRTVPENAGPAPRCLANEGLQCVHSTRFQLSYKTMTNAHQIEKGLSIVEKTRKLIECLRLVVSALPKHFDVTCAHESRQLTCRF